MVHAGYSKMKLLGALLAAAMSFAAWSDASANKCTDDETKEKLAATAAQKDCFSDAGNAGKCGMDEKQVCKMLETLKKDCTGIGAWAGFKPAFKAHYCASGCKFDSATTSC